MQGSMDDVVGKVWTALASNDGLTLSELMDKTGLPLLSLHDPMMFWIRNNEIAVTPGDQVHICGQDILMPKYHIKDRTCPPNVPECATYAEYQRSLRSQPASKRQSATPSARKNGSGKRGSQRRRKGV